MNNNQDLSNPYVQLTENPDGSFTEILTCTNRKIDKIEHAANGDKVIYYSNRVRMEVFKNHPDGIDKIRYYGTNRIVYYHKEARNDGVIEIEYRGDETTVTTYQNGEIITAYPEENEIDLVIENLEGLQDFVVTYYANGRILKESTDSYYQWNIMTGIYQYTYANEENFQANEHASYTEIGYTQHAKIHTTYYAGGTERVVHHPMNPAENIVEVITRHFKNEIAYDEDGNVFMDDNGNPLYIMRNIQINYYEDLVDLENGIPFATETRNAFDNDITEMASEGCFDPQDLDALYDEEMIDGFSEFTPSNQDEATSSSQGEATSSIQGEATSSSQSEEATIL